MLDPQAEDLTLLTHVGRPDEVQHGFGQGQDKDAVSRHQVVDRLRVDGPDRHDALAADMERAPDEGVGLA